MISTTMMSKVKAELGLKKISLNRLKIIAKRFFEDDSDEAYLIYSSAIDALSERLSQHAFRRFTASLSKNTNIKVNVSYLN